MEIFWLIWRLWQGEYFSQASLDKLNEGRALGTRDRERSIEIDIDRDTHTQMCMNISTNIFIERERERESLPA